MIDDKTLKTTPMQTVTVRDFCQRVGLSIARLYALWHRNAGPPRITVSVAGYVQPRVLVPLAAGLLWNEERQRHIHPNLKMTGEKRKQAAENERQRRERNRERLRAWNPKNLTQSLGV